MNILEADLDGISALLPVLLFGTTAGFIVMRIHDMVRYHATKIDKVREPAVWPRQDLRATLKTLAIDLTL